ncbi:MAG TPA: outer membrane beta-barrel family protein [Spirosoma sp.]|nr:outer membrane beta-barrel family protein [Spirosoma sp.]
MKRLFTFLFCLSFASLNAFSQSIQGAVRENDGKAVPFASILLLNSKDSSLVKGAVTTESGQFVIDNVRQGTYRVAVSMVGYQKRYTEPIVLSDAAPYELPALVLAPEARQLGEVTVAAKKPLFEQQLDKLVVNVSSMVSAVGSSALDVLERSPGVTVNRQQNALSLIGKSGVTVMINGKISRLPLDAIIQQLAGMNASNIDRIELITSPSARYDAEGDAGIINIILKKDSSLGTNGSYNLTAGYGFHEKLANSVSLNHRSRRLNLFGDGSALYDQQQHDFWSDRRFTNNGVENWYGSSVRHKPLLQNYNARLGVDYTLSARTTFGGLITGFFNQVSTQKNSLVTLQQGSLITERNQFEDREANRWTQGMVNLNLRHSFGKDRLLSLDVDRLQYFNTNPHDYHSRFNNLLTNQQRQEDINSSKQTPIRMWVLKADYSQPLGPRAKLELGAKSTRTRLTNDVVVNRFIDTGWQADLNFSQNYVLSDDIGAVYAILNQTLSTRTKFQAGLRYEHTRTYVSTRENPDLVARNYGNLFPSVFLSHDLGKSGVPPSGVPPSGVSPIGKPSTRSLQLSYSRRIQRPDYTLLAPWVLFVDPQTFVTGNPALLPTLTDIGQVTYRFRSSWLLTVRYSHDRNTLDRFRPRFDSTRNETVVTPQNVRSFHTASASLSFPLVLTSWWQVQTNLIGVWQSATTEINGQSVAYTNYYGNVNQSHSFNLPKGFRGELSLNYQSVMLWGLARVHPLGSVNVGVQKKFSDKQSSLALSISDLFWTNYRAIDAYFGGGTTGSYGYRTEPRTVRLTYSRSFGSQTVKGATQRTTGSEDERKRVQSTN